jgi:hypothetical protein
MHGSTETATACARPPAAPVAGGYVIIGILSVSLRSRRIGKYRNTPWSLLHRKRLQFCCR